MTSESLSPDKRESKTVIAADLLAQLQVAEGKNKELEGRLIALEERFNYILKATQDAVWDRDLLTGSEWYSDAVETLFGYNVGQINISGKFWEDNILASDRHRVLESISAAINNGEKHWQSRYRFKRADGTYAWVFDRGYIIHTSDGKPIRMVGSMHDVTAEVEAKEALRESEERFRGIFDQVAVGINIASPTGELLSVNNVFPKIFGYTEQELKRKKISDLSHPDELNEDRRLLESLLSGQTQQLARVKRYIHKTGKVIWGRVFGTVVYDKDLKPRYIVGVLEDITAEMEALEILKEREDRLRLVLASAKIGTWDFDPTSGKLLWDDRCKEMFGMKPSDYVDYEVFLQRLHPNDRELANETNRNALNGLNNGEYQMEYRAIGLHDNKLRWIRAKGKSYRNENGVCIRYAGTVIDITEEKQNEQSLREEQERFRLLATSIPQIVWTTDKEGVVDYISDKWQQYTGHVPTYDKFSFRSLIHPDDFHRVVNEWNTCLKNGTTYRGEYRLKNKLTNEYRWYSCTTAPLFDDDDQVIKWIGSATDIQDQKNNEFILEKKVLERTTELKELNERLEKSNSELEQYAYVTSHDLKEPIRKIQMYNSILRAKFSEQLTAEALDYMSKIDGATTRMSGLIQDLLKYSKISNYFQPVEDVNLNDTIQNVCSEFDYLLKEKNITVEAVALPTVPGIPIQMHQLFFNLLSNAIKFSKEGMANGITITTSVLSDADRIRMGSLANKGDYHKLVFKDQGIGFSSEYNEKIFGMFHRLNGRGKYEGHGIGLALCRKIVNNHHGMIWADGNESGGASFTIILPVSRFL